MFSIRSLIKNVQLILGGLGLIAIGLSQAIFGWISDGIFARILYGVLGTGLGGAISVGGAYMLWLQFFPQHDDDELDENIDEINLTKRAAEEARKFMPNLKVPLRVSVKNAEEGGYNYSLKLESRAPQLDDLKIRQRGITILVNESLVPLLSGTTIDFEASQNGAGFRFDNPNAGQTLAQATQNYNLRQSRARKIRFALLSGVALLSLIAVGSIGALIVSNLNYKEPPVRKISPEKYKMLHGHWPPGENAPESADAPAPVALAKPKSDLQPVQPLDPPLEDSNMFKEPPGHFARSSINNDAKIEIEPDKTPASESNTSEKRISTKAADSETRLPAVRTPRAPRSRRPTKVEVPHHSAGGDTKVLQAVSELPNKRSITFVEMSHEGRRAVIGNDANNLQVFDLVAGENLFSTSRLGIGGLESLAFSRDGRTVVTGYSSGKVVVWDLKDSGELTQRALFRCESKGPVKSLAIDDTGTLIAAGSEKLTVWSLETEEVIFKDQLKKATISCQFFDKGRSLAFSDGRSAKIVSVPQGNILKSFDKVGQGFSGCASISSDGKRLVTLLGAEATLSSLETGEPIGTFYATSARFSNDGAYIVAKYGKECLVWDSQDLVCAAKIELNSSMGRVIAMSNGQIAVVTDLNKVLKTFEFVPVQ